MISVQTEIVGRTLLLETGKVARQANGAVWVRYGDTVVLVTVVASPTPREDIDFFPLVVDYQERMYATGRIPGGFFKREGRASTKEILSGRLIDRPIRPLFPKGYRNDVQIIATVLSADNESIPDVLGIIGASAALYISDIPFNIPIGAVRVGMVDGKFIFNPSSAERDNGEMNVVVCCSKEKIMMIEAEAREVSEDIMLEAIDKGWEIAKKIIALQEELREKAGLPKVEFTVYEIDKELIEQVKEIVFDDLKSAIFTKLKKERNKKINEVIDNAIEYFSDQEEITPQQIREAVEQIQKEIVRKAILDEGRRPDGRALDELREISCEVGTLPRTHASALFTRGETQALTVATLGTAEDEQILDDIEGKSTKRFMVHYNFPPFSVGEIGGLRGPGRREIGHGALAERALLPVIPSQEEFPYTIRVVSDILESNGSTSMASTCGGSLALMDAGVPIKAPVAGISIGLVHECDRFTLLTDIIGMEDQCGDMDFKVAGTRKGITAIQVDIKILGLSREIVAAALTQAKHARNKILDIMEQAISEPNKEISPYAPKVHIITIPPDKIKDVIGPGGREIKRIVDTTGTKINIGDDGVTTISGPDKKSIEQAVEMISYLTTEIEVGQIYMGKVLRTTSFGAFIEVMPGREGLVHISQLSDSRITRVEDVVKEGDEIPVKLINIDDQGRLNFSYKMALREQGKIRYPNQNILQQQQYTRYSPKYNTKYKTV